MRKIFRKAITVLGSAALIGMTVGAASAAAYPAPFTSNTAIVVGANAAPSDNIAASSVASNLDASATAVTTGTTTGESASLASGSDLLYLNDEFNENVQTLTKDNLPTVLADGTFSDDDGTEYNFEQTLTISAHADNGFAFTNSDNDLDDPALALELSTSTANMIYNLTATFNKAVNLSATASEGEDITLFGNTYTVGTATDSDTLVLLGGSAGAIVNVGESTTITVNGISYDVALLGLSSASTTQASVSVNGDTKTFTQGQTKSVGGVDVYVKTVFRTGDDGAGYAEVQIGAGKLTLEDGSAVQTGTDADDIDGTLVAFTPTSGDQVGALTKIVISVAAEDNDVNHLLVGESFVDPVFGTVLVNFDGVENGPVFSSEKDTGRTTLEIRKGGNREMQVVVTDNAGQTATLPLAFNDVAQDDNSKAIHMVEGESIADDEYFILNSGNNHHFMKMTKVNMVTATPANSDVAMKDLLSGTTYTFDNHDFTSGYAATISGQTYTITNTSSTAVTVVSSDYGKGATGKIAVYPYLELVSGEDTRVAWTDSVAITGVTVNAVFETPTGDITLDSNATVDTESPGEVDYVVGVTAVSGTTANVTIALDVEQDASNDNANTNVSLLFVEDEDKSESTTTTKNAIIMEVDDGGTYATCSTPLFPQQSANTGYSTETWDDTDLTGWLTNYGTYVWRDTGATNQNFVGLSYGGDMMYAEVSISEGEAATSSEVGVVTVTDANVGTVAGKNLVVVGGSAINSVAAELLGAAYREAAFTSATGVGAGEFLIQSFSRAGKTALLVAGYNAADTEKAVTYLLNNAVTTTTGTKYKGTSATQASLVVA
jgi:hypothetical protein